MNSVSQIDEAEKYFPLKQSGVEVLSDTVKVRDVSESGMSLIFVICGRAAGASAAGSCRKTSSRRDRT